MFERFTEPAREVAVVAQEEARMMRHGHIGTEHLLVALADVPALGLTRERARAAVVQTVGLGDVDGAGGQLPFTAAAKEALEASVHEAMKLGHSEVQPAHILLGILRQRDGVALRVLGTGPRELREAVIRDLGAPPDDALVVRVGAEAIGDLGNPRADARLLLAILERGGPIAAWLRERGVSEDAVRRLL
jgi:ATP-dependent Clp protease ATP-binding subunit ClpC